ncbi:hypothetical protein LVY72_17400 [Arthrobacter sp. I2-34]|uniref:Uncharacterized protein n=1 Tax=Arthrobacter hankyongi TaxID=2904801 RepID=A0ABS9LAG6_9MICC|nr:hypothetical protein [Arthrobacter hankyongi]MCG2623672.1 hypothetical protein [Arthrobacter hankyongi]
MGAWNGPIPTRPQPVATRSPGRSTGIPEQHAMQSNRTETSYASNERQF